MLRRPTEQPVASREAAILEGVFPATPGDDVCCSDRVKRLLLVIRPGYFSAGHARHGEAGPVVPDLTAVVVDGSVGFVCWFRRHGHTSPRDTSTLPCCSCAAAHSNLDLLQVKMILVLCRQLDAATTHPRGLGRRCPRLDRSVTGSFTTASRRFACMIYVVVEVLVWCHGYVRR